MRRRWLGLVAVVARYATGEEGAAALARGIDRLALRVTQYLAETPP